MNLQLKMMTVMAFIIIAGGLCAGCGNRPTVSVGQAAMQSSAPGAGAGSRSAMMLFNSLPDALTGTEVPAVIVGSVYPPADNLSAS